MRMTCKLLSGAGFALVCQFAAIAPAMAAEQCYAIDFEASGLPNPYPQVRGQVKIAIDVTAQAFRKPVQMAKITPINGKTFSTAEVLFTYAPATRSIIVHANTPSAPLADSADFPLYFELSFTGFGTTNHNPSFSNGPKDDSISAKSVEVVVGECVNAVAPPVVLGPPPRIGLCDIGKDVFAIPRGGLGAQSGFTNNGRRTLRKGKLVRIRQVASDGGAATFVSFTLDRDLPPGETIPVPAGAAVQSCPVTR